METTNKFCSSKRVFSNPLFIWSLQLETPLPIIFTSLFCQRKIRKNIYFEKRLTNSNRAYDYLISSVKFSQQDCTKSTFYKSAKFVNSRLKYFWTDHLLISNCSSWNLVSMTLYWSTRVWELPNFGKEQRNKHTRPTQSWLVKTKQCVQYKQNRKYLSGKKKLFLKKTTNKSH